MRFFQAALGELGLPGRVLAVDLDPEWSAAARTADASFRSPRITDPGFDKFLLELVGRERIGLVIPTLDTELRQLSELRGSLHEADCEVVVSDTGLIDICRDKRCSDAWFRGMGLETPRLLDKANLSFPCFVKPYDGSLSKGARAIMSSEMLSADILADERNIFSELFNAQEFDEFTVDAYYDKRGELRCLVPRKRVEVRGGEISKGVALKGATYEYLRLKLQKVEGARGCLTFQCFAARDESRWVAIELNPRFGGGFPLSYFAGAKYPEWLVREYLLGEVIPTFGSWKDRTAMVRYDSEIIFSASDDG